MIRRKVTVTLDILIRGDDEQKMLLDNQHQLEKVIKSVEGFENLIVIDAEILDNDS